MSKLDRSSLLQFLSKPRFIHEVAEQFHISPKLAKHQLQEEVKFGKILVSAKEVHHSFLDSRGRLKQLEEFLYVSKNSPLLDEGSLKITTRNRKFEKFTLRKGAGIAFVRFLPEMQTVTQNSRNEKSVSYVRRAGTPQVAVQSRSERKLMSRFPNLFETEAKLAKRSINDKWVKGRTRSDRDERKSLSHMEKIRLFQALLDKPLPFLDLRGRFGVSKQTVRRFLKRGYLEEVWGSNDIGVKFKLTEKGKAYLKRLEGALPFEYKQPKKFFIHLKHRISSLL